MSLELIILILSYIVLIFLLIKYVSKDKIREAQVIFLFKQVMTWLLGFIVVEHKLISYPQRLFAYAARTSFTFEYFIFPAISILFNLYYPFEKGLFRKLCYYFSYVSTITLIEVVLERYTELIEYHNWHWYWTWLSLCTTFYLSNKYYRWFFKIKKSN